MQFWELSFAAQKWTAEIDHDELKSLEEQHGDMMPRFRALRVPGVSQPVRLAGSIVRDFTWTWYGQCLIQDRVLQMLRDEGFTGFQVHPVSANWKRPPKRGLPANGVPEIPIIWELIPLGWGGVAPEESGMHLVRVDPATGRKVYSKYTDPAKLVDEGQWDGSDFFILWPLPGHMFVSDRVAQFIKREDLTGAKMTRIQDLVWPGGIGDNCMPAPLHYYLPEPRASELGKPLGIY